MAVAGAAYRDTTTRDEAAELAEIERWYRDALTEPAVLPVGRWAPVRIGPTWQTTPDGHWLLPDASLGWAVLAWSGLHLQHRLGEPWTYTLEQARWLLWWYALDERGRFLRTDAVLQRLKGWGKDPLGACVCLNELVGPVRFGGWADNDTPVAVDVPEAWVATAAVGLEQTKNTMRLLPSLPTPEALVRFGLQIGKESVYALGDERFMQAVTSSPRSLQGRRHTFVLLNETHEWVASNAGHDMTAVLEDNAAKSPGGAARTVRITNAPQPGEDSVAERDWDAYEAALTGEAEDPGILYDSLEAHAEAPLIVTVRVDPTDPDSDIDHDATRDATRDAITEVVQTVRGDAWWLSIERIVTRVLDVRSPPSRSRRMWFNQKRAAEDARFLPADVDRAARPDEVLAARERVVLFGDLSKSDDATALVGCRLADGHVFTINVWVPGRRGDGHTVSRAEVAHAIREAITGAGVLAGRYDVAACWIDPGEMTEEETGRPYWSATLDELHRELAPRLSVWASGKSSTRPHALAWDMRSPANDQQFTEAVETFAAELESGEVTHDGHPLLVRHLKNARRRPGRYGVGMGKEHRESKKKIDAGVAAVGARMLRRIVLNREAAEPKKPRTGFVV